MPVRYFLIINLAVLGLVTGACSTAFTGTSQEVTVYTPGAQDAECHLSNRDFHYRVEAGKPRLIEKSSKKLTVRCLAPGNREEIVVVKPKIEKIAATNLANGVFPGMAYDHYSNALYDYPEHIFVNFRDNPAKPYPMPRYHNSDLPNPLTAQIEPYGPQVPVLEADKSRPPHVLGKLDESAYLYGNPFGPR